MNMTFILIYMEKETPNGNVWISGIKRPPQYNEKLKTRIGLKLHTKIAKNYKKAKKNQWILVRRWMMDENDMKWDENITNAVSRWNDMVEKWMNAW